MQFEHEETLDFHRKVICKFTPDDADITFELHVETLGYVALGFSPNGGMAGADMFVAWVDSKGKAHGEVSRIFQ